MRMYGREKSEVVKPTKAVSAHQEHVERIDEELLLEGELGPVDDHPKQSASQQRGA